MRFRAFIRGGAALIAFAIGGVGSDARAADRVVAYIALDRIFSEPIIRDFEKETGIRVEAVYDVEASKTIGLVNRIIAEKSRPMCDVFWNNEIVQTLRLAEMGLLAPYESPQAEGLPADMRDPEKRWTGFAARARVIIYNTEKIQESELPLSIRQWSDPRWKGQFAVANPRFGTTTTHMAALLAHWDAERVRELWMGWHANGLALLAGNATVKNDVGAGRFAFGLTDTDDAFGALEDGMPVGIAYPEEGLFIPNTIALLQGAPRPEAGKRLIDYVLRPETEARLAVSRAGQIPLHAGVPRPDHVPAPDAVNSVPVEWRDVAGRAEESARLMNEILDQMGRS